MEMPNGQQFSVAIHERAYYVTSSYILCHIIIHLVHISDGDAERAAVQRGNPRTRQAWRDSCPQQKSPVSHQVPFHLYYRIIIVMSSWQHIYEFVTTYI